MRYRIHHETVYAYASDVLHAHHMLHLVPRPAPFQQCLEHSISVKPATFRRRDEIDTFGNALTRIEFEHPHRRLEVVTQMEVHVHPRPKVFGAHSIPWERLCADLAYHGAWPTRENLEACRFRHESPYVRVKREFTDYAAECFPAGRPILECAEKAPWRLPGLCPSHDRLLAITGPRRALCQRVSARGADAQRRVGRAACDRIRRFTRLGGGLHAAVRLARVRSHQ
jgi:hypothetical protein